MPLALRFHSAPNTTEAHMEHEMRKGISSLNYDLGQRRENTKKPTQDT